MQAILDAKVVLELCPSSNLATRAVEGLSELGHILRTFSEHQIPITINTDGTYFLNTNLQREFDLLVNNKLMTRFEAETTAKRAFEASFIRG